VTLGVWAILTGDFYNSIDRVFIDELECRRYATSQGYYVEVLFIPWGMDVTEARKAETESKNSAAGEIPEIVDTRDPECVKKWPECESMAYDPRCCRFPKSCSAG
jgi:hypothetical protein